MEAKHFIVLLLVLQSIASTTCQEEENSSASRDNDETNTPPPNTPSPNTLPPNPPTTSPPPVINQCKEANRYSCSGCNQIVYCASNGGNGLIPIPIFKCDADTYCNDDDPDNPTCATEPPISCIVQKPYSMECSAAGVYPHPFDCRKYFICLKPDGTRAIPIACLSGFAFDPSTLRCSIKFNSTATCKPLVECSSAGVFPVAGNRRLYYKCTNAKDGYDVELRYCFGNLIFVDGRCVQPDFTPGLNKDGVCTKTGSFMVGDCKRYNLCSAIGWRPYAQSCAQGMLFDPKEQKCIPFSCPT